MTLTNDPVGRVNSNLLERSAAARIHASTRGVNLTHISPTFAKPRHTDQVVSLAAHATAGTQPARPPVSLSPTLPHTHTTDFVFKWTTAAATHNLDVIRHYGGISVRLSTRNRFQRSRRGRNSDPFTCWSLFCLATPNGRRSRSGLPTARNSLSPTFSTPITATLARGKS